MPTFKDVRGQEWVIDVDVDGIRIVRDRLDYDLVDISEESVNKLYDDPVLLVDVIWLLCESQATARNIKDVDFGRSLKGDAIEEATAALLESIADFFPGSRRSLLKKVIKSTAEMRQAVDGMAIDQINNPDLLRKVLTATKAKMESEIDDYLTRLKSPTNSPASSASTPAPTP
jgi:hypothetical protein